MRIARLASSLVRASTWTGGAIALSLVVSTACGERPSEVPAPDPDQRAQQLIESGNQAYRAGNYGLAARRYAAAAVVREDDPAAYYGMGMALSKLGRDEEARQAYRRARELAQAQTGTARGAVPDPAPVSP